METKKQNPKGFQLNEILADNQCRLNIQSQINKVLSAQIKALEGTKAGVRLKRNPVTILEEMQMLSPHTFCTEYELIICKRSTLPSREREYILQVVNSAIIETVRAKQKEYKITQ